MQPPGTGLGPFLAPGCHTLMFCKNHLTFTGPRCNTEYITSSLGCMLCKLWLNQHPIYYYHNASSNINKASPKLGTICSGMYDLNQENSIKAVYTTLYSPMLCYVMEISQTRVVSPYRCTVNQCYVNLETRGDGQGALARLALRRIYPIQPKNRHPRQNLDSRKYRQS